MSYNIDAIAEIIDPVPFNLPAELAQGGFMRQRRSLAVKKAQKIIALINAGAGVTQQDDSKGTQNA